MYARVAEKIGRDEINLEDEEAVGSLCRLSGRAVSPKSAMEQEKRIRREIANSNERRRMQSINAGFASLKTLLPHQEGEKLSKASILQQTADYIYQLEQEKTRLLAQNCQLKRLLNQHHHSDVEASPSGAESPNDDRSTNASSPVILSTTVIPEQSPTSTGIEMVLTDNSNQYSVSSKDDRTPNPEVRTDLLRSELLKANNVSRNPRTDRDGPSKKIKMEESFHALKNEDGDVELLRVGPNKGTILEHKLIDSHVKMERPSPSATPKEARDLEPLVKEEPCVEDVDSPAIQKYAKMILKNHNAAAPVISGRNGSISVLNGSTTYSVDVSEGYAVNVSEGYSSSNFRISGSHSSSPATIVTVLPSSKCDLESLPSVLELHSINENGSPVHQSGGTSSRRSSNLPNGLLDLYIVNSSTSNCQKSLDTICEAIRHLEGDHMFPPERHHQLMEEEVITEEEDNHPTATFTVEGSEQPRLITLDEHHQHHPIVLNNDYQFDVSIAQHPHHHIVGADGAHSLDLSTLPLIEEPQEAPLELTTTHRGSSVEHHNYGVESCRGRSSIHHSLPHSTSSIDDMRDNVIHLPPQTSKHVSMRPGVIVVQQP